MFRWDPEQFFNSKPGLVKLFPKEVEIHVNMKAVCDHLWDQIFKKTWRWDFRQKRLGTTDLREGEKSRILPTDDKF